MADMTTKDSDPGTLVEHDLILSRILSLFFQSVLFGAFAMAYVTTWLSLKSTKQSQLLEKRETVLRQAITVMLLTAFFHLCLTFNVTLSPTTGYEGRVDTQYLSFEDEYSLFFSANGFQYYLYVTQTTIANCLLTYILYLKANGNPKAFAPALSASVLATAFGYSASAGGL
ncbi:hypothetical protein BD311DRAFT_778328 [Dichomitus squalens]|uniref:Uncharacterized protein n=1 Tax=Dichomitus squalens TaxID=114155 RepID=A0A4Q9MLN2_9APHY|nr:hypothetical protein BD311DRAFT_778328 [Dichomitus squalens]